MPKEGAICITGASGLVGGLCAAALLRATDRPLVLLHRAQHSRESILAPIRAELLAQKTPFTDEDERRTSCLELPANTAVADLAPLLREAEVSEIVHAAGCVDYFDSAALHEGNEALTAALLALGRTLKLRRFVFLSTAFSCGFGDPVAGEAVHPEPLEDPTEYTKSKRACEALVAASGLPFLVLRPSILIGDSKDGRYAGKTYGIYQLWASCERLFSDRYTEVFHAIAPRTAVHVLHQDAFMAGLVAALAGLPDGSYVNLVSDQSALPTLRSYWEMFARDWTGPREVHCYASADEFPKTGVDRRQSLLASFSAVNLEIASRHFHFERGHLERLREGGMQFADATEETLAICQRRFMQESLRIQSFLVRFGGARCKEPRMIEAGPSRLQSVG